jgi:hypothetical protein
MLPNITIRIKVIQKTIEHITAFLAVLLNLLSRVLLLEKKKGSNIRILMKKLENGFIINSIKDLS